VLPVWRPLGLPAEPELREASRQAIPVPLSQAPGLPMPVLAAQAAPRLARRLAAEPLAASARYTWVEPSESVQQS
jgi:hypothetical protein